jgi:DNA-binding CsgD family transcriptional regulator
VEVAGQRAQKLPRSLAEAMSTSMLSRFAVGTPHLDPIERLTNRELQILHMIGKGASTRETARLLHLSIKTIESHRQRIKRKLSLTTAAQLLRYAVLSHAQRQGSPAVGND